MFGVNIFGFPYFGQSQQTYSQSTLSASDSANAQDTCDAVVTYLLSASDGATATDTASTSTGGGAGGGGVTEAGGRARQRQHQHMQRLLGKPLRREEVIFKGPPDEATVEVVVLRAITRSIAKITLPKTNAQMIRIAKSAAAIAPPQGSARANRTAFSSTRRQAVASARVTSGATRFGTASTRVQIGTASAKALSERRAHTATAARTRASAAATTERTGASMRFSARGNAHSASTAQRQARATVMPSRFHSAARAEHQMELTEEEQMMVLTLMESDWGEN